jgi:tetratricopeptide (TPR) repeat protein
VLIQSGSYAAAQTVLEEFDAALDDVTEEQTMARLQADQTALQAFIHRRQGEFDAALNCADRALAQYRAVDDRQGVADTLQGLGLVRWHRDGDVEAATADLSEALEGFRAVGDRGGEANCMNNLGIMARARGELDAAAEWFEQSYAVRRSIEAGHHIVDSLINLGVVARDRGNLDAAIRRLRRAVERAREYGGTDYRAHSMRALGKTLHRREADGDLEDAAAYLEEALALDRAAGIRFAEGHCLRGLAAVNRKRGDLAAARARIADAEAAYAEAGADRDRALATRERGRIAYAGGDDARARRLLGESVDALEASDRRPGLAATRVDYAKALLETGDSNTAATQLDAALAWFREIDADRYIAAIERLQDEAEQQQQHQPSTDPYT